MNISFIGFSLCAAGFSVLLAVLLIGRRGGSFNLWLSLAVGLQAVWAILMMLASTPFKPHPVLLSIAELTRIGAWILFVLMVPSALQQDKGHSQNLPKHSIKLLWVLGGFIAAAFAAELFINNAALPFGIRVGLAVLGLYCVEQLYRQVPATGRWATKYLIVGLIGLFGFDLALYSEALLYAVPIPNWWNGRGYANALILPLIAIGAARAREMKVVLSVSHRLAFQSATMVAAGAYLVVVALISYLLQLLGGTLADLLQILLAFAALVGLGVLALSPTIRAKFRVFIAKNFFAYQFDYREEWLKFTDAMSSSDGKQMNISTIAERSAQALCRLVETKRAAVWVADDQGHFQLIANQNIAKDIPATILASDSLIRFLSQQDWVISCEEYRAQPKMYNDLQLPPWATTQEAVLLLPCKLQNQLIGLIFLSDPMAKLTVNWEVRDLLKTLGRQIAGYFSLQQATRSLIELRQFESFNRLSAFVVHDLKNLVAQLSLLMTNAQRHKDNPEFQADMLSTVENVLGRMQGLLLQLRVGVKPADPAVLVDLRKMIEQAIASKGQLYSKLNVRTENCPPDGVWVLGHPERLVRVIGHLIQNADEACRTRFHGHDTSEPATITIELIQQHDRQQISVRDNGVGMDADFLRNELFRPFNTTKSMGMGIGTFESREYIREIGGELRVTSSPGNGSEFTISLPKVKAESGVAAESRVQ